MSATFLLSLFRRDGPAAIAKAIRYGFSPRAWRWLLTNMHYRRIVKKSGLLDAAWYRREYPEVAEKGLDPVQDFLTPPHDRIRLPNPDFVPGEYASTNFDVKESGLPWAVHYAKDGMREGRSVSSLESAGKPFPPGAAEFRREYTAVPAKHRRTAVFASFSGDGRIKDSVLLYLRGLREVVDNVVFVCNAPVFPAEADKLSGLVRLAVFRHHGCYDFGSYKIGWDEANALGLLAADVCDELVVCNDSCYGPVFPFSESFSEMVRRNREAKPEDMFDFWGMTAHELFGRPHLQSYFLVFGKAVLEEPSLAGFFEELQPCRSRGQTVCHCETSLSPALVDAGHKFDSLVPAGFHGAGKHPPIKYPVTLLSKWRMPLLKAKTLRGESKESVAEAVGLVRRANPALAALLPPPPPKTAFETEPADGFAGLRKMREGHAAAMDETASAIRSAGRRIRILFLSTAADPFPGGSLVEKLRGDAAFDVSAAIVPDLRLEPPFECFAAMRSARAALEARLPSSNILRAEPDSDGDWNDLAAGADVVVWGTAENASDFRYNPHYAVGRSVLPVLVFDRNQAGPYPLEKEFARQNYAYFWKIFFSDREAFDLYAKHSIRKGENAVLVRDSAEAAAKLDASTRESVRQTGTSRR